MQTIVLYNQITNNCSEIMFGIGINKNMSTKEEDIINEERYLLFSCKSQT